MDFWDDGRGQSVQVGAVLLFAIVVILLAGYQSTIVPNDNRAAEFDHSLETQQDMLDVRNSIIEAYLDGEAAPVSVKLGTTYPRHTFAVNPAPVSGRLQTTPGGNVSVSDAGGPVDACAVSSETKMLNYSVSYNYYRPTPTLVYENTLLYSDYGDGNRVMVSDQSLVSGSIVNLVALQGNYSENGIGVTDFQPKSGQYKSTPVEDPIIEVPTRLSESEWERLLESEVQHPDNVTVTDTAEGRTLQVELTGSYDVRCGLVGSNTVPEGGPRQGGGGADINPAGPGTVSVENFQYITSDGTVQADFNNTADTSTNITKARLAFYYASTGGKAPDGLTIAGHSEIFYVGDPFQTLASPIEIPANGKTTLTFADESGAKLSKGDYFIIQLEFENGEQGTYFIFIPN